RNDLPRESVAILEPATRPRLTSLRELGPELVDLVLALAADLERHGPVEREPRPAVQSHERAPVELEADRHHAPGLARPGLAVAAGLADPRVRAERDVAARSRPGLAVKPQEGGDASHACSFRRLPRPSDRAA